MFESTLEKFGSFKGQAEEVLESVVESIDHSELLESFSPYGNHAATAHGTSDTVETDNGGFTAIPQQPVFRPPLDNFHAETSNMSHPQHHAKEQSDDNTITTTTTSSQQQRALGTIQLAVIIFYSVSGGPFGMEEAVRAGGAFCTLVGLLLLPLVWSVPEALVTAELGSAFPEASGEVAWVEHAFGRRAAWMSGYFTWVSGVTDNAIYPVLFLQYLLQLVSFDLDTIDPWMRFAMISSLAILLGYINWSGLPVVGELSVSICILSMSPFVLFCIFSVNKIDPQNWLRMPSTYNGTTWNDDDEDDDSISYSLPIFSSVIWLRPFLNNMFWNLNSFDSAASFAGEVQDPGRVFPSAMFWSVLFVVAGYFIPMLFVLGASDAPQEAWVDGYLASVAYDVVGPWLGAWTVFAAGISNIALFQAEMSSDAFQLMGMAHRGYLPSFLGTRSKHGTPTYGILIGTLIVVVMGVSDMSSLIEMLNFSYSISLLMEFAAFLKLRFSASSIPRPYRVPLSTFGCCLMLTPTILLNLLVMSMASIKTLLFSVGVIVLGGLLFCFGIRRRRRWQEDVLDEQNDENLSVTEETVELGLSAREEESTLIS